MLKKQSKPLQSGAWTLLDILTFSFLRKNYVQKRKIT